MPNNERILNIISNCAKSSDVSGPRKVFENACKGLELIGQRYVVNQKPSDFAWNWVHDSIEGLIEVAFRSIPAVIGPNIAVLPKDLPRFRPRLKKCIYLHPSKWVTELWEGLGFTECPLVPWPVGIDMNSFDLDRENVENNQVMVYYKERHPKLLVETLDILRKLKLEPNVILYGSYNEEMYRTAISKCLFGIWIGRQESQGIALQEALASGLPLIVVEAKSLFDYYARNEYKFPTTLKTFRTTTAPYFDERCGIIINSTDELVDVIEDFILSINKYKPREYVHESLSLEVCAQKLVSILEQLSIENKCENNMQPKYASFDPSLLTKMVLKVNRAMWLFQRI